MVKKITPLIIVIVFTIFSGLPLLEKGLHPTHDGEYHIIRFYEFYKVLESGVLYPRIAPDLNNGYGVPLFNFVYPLPNYIASLFHIIGFSFIDAFKLQMFIAGILGGVFFYLWTKRYWGVKGGIVSSVFYTYSPYHFLDVYVRGSVGEVWALAFFPAFFYLYDKFLETKKKKYLFLSSITIAFIIFSHNILSMIFAFLALSYMIFWLFQKKGTIKSILLCIIFALGISSIFWMPAIFEKHLVRGLQIYSVRSEFPELYELIVPSWGTSFLATDPGNKMSFQIGIGNLVSIFLSIFVFFYVRKKNKQNALLMFYFFCSLCISFFLILKISYPIWNMFLLSQYIQFPWRFLSFVIFISSFFAGSVFLIRNSTLLAICMVCVVVFLGTPYTKPAYYHQRDDMYYITRSNFIDGTNSPGNLFNTIWFDASLKKKKQRIEGKNLLVKKQEIKPTNYLFQTLVKDGSIITVNSAYFPGWAVYVDGNKVKIDKTEQGLFSFVAPEGIHSIKIFFENTPIRIFAVSVSVMSILLIGLLLLPRFAKIKV